MRRAAAGALNLLFNSDAFKIMWQAAWAFAFGELLKGDAIADHQYLRTFVNASDFSHLDESVPFSGDKIDEMLYYSDGCQLVIHHCLELY